ncbi:MAG: carbohydrate kinase [Oscillospiraceae bacterium]|nr:carbohydrate kinase [Oscillospiraceae bacterium]
MRYDVISIGELLIDFTDCGISARGNPLFEANPGGGPCNTLAMLARLGRKTAFIGKVGADMFGRMLAGTLEQAGIDTEGLLFDENANTTLAFVHNAPDGEREFSFYRKHCADTLLRGEELNAALLSNCSLFHFSSVSMTQEPSRTATASAAAQAKRAGAVIAFDPNLRKSLWDSLDEARRQIAWGCSVCDVLKIGDDELRFLAGEEDLDACAARLWEQYPQIRMLFLTKGRAGAEGFWGKHRVSHPAFNVNTVDTTGAGDTFFGCCLSYVLDISLDGPSEAVLRDMMEFASAAAALVTAKRGALRVMPGREEILELIRKRSDKDF